jgi:thiopurine S-methyltransferase
LTPEFWRERWAKREIGFHQDRVHPQLEAQASWFLSGNRRILVPLCGKTLDIGWLAGQGHEVVGVELASEAVAELTESLTPVFGRFERSSPGGLTVWTAGPVTVVEGNFFDVAPGAFGKLDRCWDRGALVAVGPDLFERYAAHERALLTPDAEMLLQAFDYDQSTRPGPPWSVPETMIRRLYDGAEIALIEEHDEVRADGRAMRVQSWSLKGLGRG